MRDQGYGEIAEPDECPNQSATVEIVRANAHR